ncbi:MAG: D-alanyl-D-alanine carboxypeptidase [Ruminococcus sp.]|nr:D-alanyl-D-alanine carboxypeptidase [Ruminococcus sp.]
MFRRAMVLLSVAALFASEPLPVTAENAAEEVFPEVSAAACCLFEAGSETPVFLRNADVPRPMGHMAKLMTVLICAEACTEGKASMSDTVTVSANANSKQGAQIWLDAGEEITVSELMKSIIIGNAGDACCALSEYLSGSEEQHTKRMNARAEKLGMENTRFAEPLGESEDTVSTARDIALLTAELSRHHELDELFTTRIDRVRDGKTELVSTNRLILSYKGIRGTKACGGIKAGECIAACADRNGMTMCAVLLGEPDADSKLRDARELLDCGFESCRLFVPEADGKYLKDITVTGGCADKTAVRAEKTPPALIMAGTAGDIELRAEVTKTLKAPVKRGQTVGTLEYRLGGEKIAAVKIVAASDVERMNFGFALKRTLFNLLDITY